MTKREDPDYVDPIRTEQDYRGESRRVLTLNWTTVGMLVLALLFVSVVSLLMPHSFGTKSANQQVCTWLAGVQSRFAPQFAALPVVSATQEDAGAFENLLNQEATEYATEYMNTGSEFAPDLRDISSALQGARIQFTESNGKSGNALLKDANAQILSLSSSCDQLKK
jgi:hypothetical protein